MSYHGSLMKWFNIGHTYTFVVSRCERIDGEYYFILRYQGKETKPGWFAAGWKLCVRVSKSQELYPLESFEGKKLRCRVVNHKAQGFPILKQEITRYKGDVEKIKLLKGSYEPSRKDIDSLYKPKVLTFITVKGEIVEHEPIESSVVEHPVEVGAGEKIECKDDEPDESNAIFTVEETLTPEVACDEIETGKELAAEEEWFQRCLHEAEKGDAEAQYQVSLMYKDGTGVEKDICEAIEWCKKSARGGFGKAICHLYNLGKWFEDNSRFDEAFECYEIAAKQGWLDAQFKVAEFQESGCGGCDRDLNAAVEFYLLQAQQGNQRAQNSLWDILHNNLTHVLDRRVVVFLLGLCYENGWGVNCSDSEALLCYGKATQSGDFGDYYGESLYRMGVIEERQISLGMAMRFYKKAKNAGYPDAVEAIRRVRRKENEKLIEAKVNETKAKSNEPEKEPEEAPQIELSAEEQYTQGLRYLACKDALSVHWRDDCVAYLLAAADKGHVDAQYVLGTVYMDEENIPLAMEFYTKAAELGHAEAQYNMGMYHELGLGGKVDLLRAFDYFKRAAEQGGIDACYKVGVYYMVGDGVDYDEGLAFEWLKKAADAGHTDAAYRVGLSYLGGKGVSHDAAAALPYLEIAAMAGGPEAMYLIACCYEEGQEVAGNLLKALIWYEKAAEAGIKEAVETLISPRWIIRKIKFADIDHGHSK